MTKSSTSAAATSTAVNIPYETSELLLTGSLKNDREGPDKLLRLSQIIGPKGLIPISKSTFYAYIKAGWIEAPQRLGPRISVWKEADIQAFIERLGGDNA